jgi:predicted O-linked N-acetylglucosamine transferase (SPINDLY family)
VFAPFVPRPAHYARHRAADLFLDPLVYNGAATTTLALQAGLPVLACMGQTFASRVGASLLTTAGLADLVAADPADYEERAVRLAHHPDALAALRAKVEAARGCPLFDTPRFARHLEQAYRVMWDLYESGQAPRPIRVGGT